jgi:antitoxin HicB
MNKKSKTNKRSGSNFDDFLREEGLYEEVQAAALKRVVSEQLLDGMHSAGLTKAAMARSMSTSRAHVDRVLSPSATSIQIDTLVRAATAIGKELDIRFIPMRAHSQLIALGL